MDVEFGSDLGEIEEVEIVGYTGRLFRRIIRASEQKSTREQLRQRADSDSHFVFSSSRITMLYQVDVSIW